METLNNEIGATYECDVLVIGSGVSGYCAAIQAGRCGRDTILVEKDEVLGGNSGPNLGVGITGAGRYNTYGIETGLIQELQEDTAWMHAFTHSGGGAMPYSISRRNEALVQEYLEKAGVRVLKRHYAKKPIMNGNRIAGIIAEDLAAFRTVRIDVRYVVIEASGDGHIGAQAGADYDVGSESKDEFNERSAPAERTNLVQGTSLVAIALKTEHEVVYIPPADLPPFPPRVWHGTMSSYLNHHSGMFGNHPSPRYLYMTEAGGQMDTIKDDAEIYEILLKQLWAEWDHIKNGPHKEEAKNWDVLWVSPKAGKRESRRFLGDYILTQTDLEEGRLFPDDITYGGHDLDDHQPLGDGSNIFGHSIPPMYGVPYRTCYSRNIDNLFLAGRLISATHLAHSSTRIMRTGAAIGQAVGIAAAMCCQYNCSPRDIYSDRLDELQEGLMRADATILCRPLDPAPDLARKATARASSEMRFNDQKPGHFVPLLAQAGNVLWDWDEKLDSVEFFLRNGSDAEQSIEVTVYRARRDRKWKTVEEYSAQGWDDLDDSAFKEMASTSAVVPPNHNDWYKVAFPEPVQIGKKDAANDGDRIIIALGKNQNMSWATVNGKCDMAEMVEHSHHSPKWKKISFAGTMRISPSIRLGEAENAINGFHRRFSRGPTNMWMSDPAEGFPQEIVLSWSELQRFNQVTLTFDNLPEKRHNNPWELGHRVLYMCIKSYELSVWENGGWKEIAKEECNYHRFRVHSFDPVETSKLRLRVLGTHGPGYGARVYQIGVYKE